MGRRLADPTTGGWSAAGGIGLPGPSGGRQFLALDPDLDPLADPLDAVDDDPVVGPDEFGLRVVVGGEEHAEDPVDRPELHVPALHRVLGVDHPDEAAALVGADRPIDGQQGPLGVPAGDADPGEEAGREARSGLRKTARTLIVPVEASTRLSAKSTTPA